MTDLQLKVEDLQARLFAKDVEITRLQGRITNLIDYAKKIQINAHSLRKETERASAELRALSDFGCEETRRLTDQIIRLTKSLEDSNGVLGMVRGDLYCMAGEQIRENIEVLNLVKPWDTK